MCDIRTIKKYVLLRIKASPTVLLLRLLLLAAVYYNVLLLQPSYNNDVRMYEFCDTLLLLYPMFIFIVFSPYT